MGSLGTTFATLFDTLFCTLFCTLIGDTSATGKACCVVGGKGCATANTFGFLISSNREKLSEVVRPFKTFEGYVLFNSCNCFSTLVFLCKLYG